MARLVYFEHPTPAEMRHLLPGVTLLGDHSRPIDPHWQTVWLCAKYCAQAREKYGVDIELFHFSDNTPNPAGAGSFPLCALFCIEAGVQVLGMSRQILDDYDNRAAMAALKLHGIHVVTIPGNSYQQSAPNWHSLLPWVISSGASDSATGKTASYNLPGWHILAPGDRPDMPIPQRPGNSYAAPEVAAYVAALCAVNPGLTHDDAKGLVLASADANGVLVWPPFLPVKKGVNELPKPDYSDAKWVGSCNYTPGRAGEKPIAVVIHTMAGYLEGNRSWFNNPAAQCSAHYGIGKNGEVHQYVAEADTAWHAGAVRVPDWKLYKGSNPNRYTVGVELEGFSEPPTDAQYSALAALLSDVCKRYGITPGPDTLIGHYRINSVDRPNCPGLTFPWQRLYSDLQAGDAPSLYSSLVGLSVNRVEGIWLDGRKLEAYMAVVDDETGGGTGLAPVRALCEALGLSVKYVEGEGAYLTTN